MPLTSLDSWVNCDNDDHDHDNDDHDHDNDDDDNDNDDDGVNF